MDYQVEVSHSPEELAHTMFKIDVDRYLVLPTSGQIASVEAFIEKIDTGPLGAKHAARWAKKLIGAYPLLNAHNPEMYAVAMAAKLGEYSNYDCGRIVARVLNDVKYPPTVADIENVARSGSAHFAQYLK